MLDKKKEVLDIVASLVSKQKKKTVSIDSRLREDLGFDSIKLITLIMELEQKLGIDVISLSQKADLTDIQTVKDIENIINANL